LFTCDDGGCSFLLLATGTTAAFSSAGVEAAGLFCNIFVVVVVVVVVVQVLDSGELAAAAPGPRAHIGGDLVVTVTRGAWCVVTLSAGSHSGEMELDLVSAVRGCNRSGDRARRNSGDPGSDVLHGRPNDEPAVFLTTTTAPPLTALMQQPDGPPIPPTPAVAPHPDTATPPAPAAPGLDDVSDDGLYDCVVLELPGWWPDENVSGLGDRVGDCGSGDGEGVRASGDSGIWPTDLRRFGECRFLVAECSLCLSPCSVDGRWYGVGELGVTVGEELADELEELVEDE